MTNQFPSNHIERLSTTLNFRIMRLFTLCPLLILLFFYNPVQAQCSSNSSICSSGVAGPFGFAAPGDTVSSCLDFIGPGYAYIVLYITQSGPLEMLINGDSTSGFLDVAIFNVPDGVDPCVAIQDVSNEISCNYASAAGGCNQIGSYFLCSSSVPSPTVNAGDRLMIVVENWSAVSTSFTLELAPSPAAQTGPADPTISAPGSLTYTSTPPFQMTAADMGGGMVRPRDFIYWDI